MLSSKQIAQRAACEVRRNDHIYVDAGFAKNVQRFLHQSGYTLSDGSSPVDVAFLSAARVCGGGNYLESPPLNGLKRREWFRIPVRGTRQTVILIPDSAYENEWLVARCDKETEPDRKASCRIITNMAVVDITDRGLIIREVAPGISAWEVQKTTDATLLAGPKLCRIEFD